VNQQEPAGLQAGPPRLGPTATAFRQRRSALHLNYLEWHAMQIALPADATFNNLPPFVKVL